MNRLALFQARRAAKDYINAAEGPFHPFAAPVLALAAILWGLVCGLLVTQLPPVVAVLGMVLLLLAAFKPEFIILLLLVMSSTILDPKIVPTINVVFKFTAVELCLGLLLGLVAARFLLNTHKSTFVRTALDLPVLLFFVASTISFFNAQYNLGVDRGWLVPQWRIIFDYLVFFAVTNLVRTRQQFVTFTRSFMALAAITATLAILQEVLGSSIKILPRVTLMAANVFEQEYANVPRVIVPGTPLVHMMILPALVLYSLRDRPHTGKGALLPITIVLLSGAAIFTFDRTWWMGILLAVAILLVIGSAKQRSFLLKRMGLAAAVLVLAIQFTSAYSPQAAHVVQVLGLRAGSLFTERIVNDSGTQWRLREIDSAIAKVQEHPILGVGPGGILREQWWKGDDLTRFMHNSYLFILADLGILGFLPFLAFSVAFLFRGFYFGRKLSDSTLKAWVLGLTLSYVALMVASMAGPDFMAAETVPVIGVILGINEVAIRLGQPAQDTTRILDSPPGRTEQDVEGQSGNV